LSHDGHHEETESPREALPESPGPVAATERKRLMARRLFLLGGAASLPVIVSTSRRQALAAGDLSDCLSLGDKVIILGPGGQTTTCICKVVNQPPEDNNGNPCVPPE